jgi:hypothetical protein
MQCFFFIRQGVPDIFKDCDKGKPILQNIGNYSSKATPHPKRLASSILISREK